MTLKKKTLKKVKESLVFRLILGAEVPSFLSRSGWFGYSEVHLERPCLISIIAIAF